MSKDVTIEMWKVVIFEIFLKVLFSALDSSTNLALVVDQFIAGQYVGRFILKKLFTI